VAGAAYGQATRTWVSGVGDDVNPCSRTAPCKTFAGAVSKTAAGGEIDALDPGGFGAVTLTKSMTLQGTGTMGSILASGTTGVLVNGAGAIVTLRNLSINGGTPAGIGVNGVRFIQGSKLIVENVDIQNFSNKGISMEVAGTVEVINTTISNCTNIGFAAQPTSPPATIKATLNNVRLVYNGTGAYIANGGIATINNTDISFNTNSGLVSEQNFGTTTVNLNSSVLSQNGTGITAGNGASTTRINHSQILNNTVGFSFVGGGQILSYLNNQISGNGGATNNPSGTASPALQ
jgi:hypothetical protein